MEDKTTAASDSENIEAKEDEFVPIVNADGSVMENAQRLVGASAVRFRNPLRDKEKKPDGG